MSENVGALRVETKQEARAAVDEFRDRPKILSWLVLRAAGLPTPRGIIVTRWNRETAQDVADYIEDIGANSLLLRSDAAAETGRAPRGGYLVTLSDLAREGPDLVSMGRTLFLLEPESPFDDVYSATLEPDAHWHDWAVEVVGAGFDASDLKRGDVTPHERITISVTSEHVLARTREIATDAVQATVREIRLDKVARMLGCERNAVEAELRRRGESLLADELHYRPIPEVMITAAVRSAASVRLELDLLQLRDRGISISLSFLGECARLTFWDIVWPHTKYRVDSV